MNVPSPNRIPLLKPTSGSSSQTESSLDVVVRVREENQRGPVVRVKAACEARL